MPMQEHEFMTKVLDQRYHEVWTWDPDRLAHRPISEELVRKIPESWAYGVLMAVYPESARSDKPDSKYAYTMAPGQWPVFWWAAELWLRKIGERRAAKVFEYLRTPHASERKHFGQRRSDVSGVGLVASWAAGTYAEDRSVAEKFNAGYKYVYFGLPGLNMIDTPRNHPLSLLAWTHWGLFLRVKPAPEEKWSVDWVDRFHEWSYMWHIYCAGATHARTITTEPTICVSPRFKLGKRHRPENKFVCGMPGIELPPGSYDLSACESDVGVAGDVLILRNPPGVRCSGQSKLVMSSDPSLLRVYSSSSASFKARAIRAESTDDCSFSCEEFVNGWNRGVDVHCGSFVVSDNSLNSSEIRAERLIPNGYDPEFPSGQVRLVGSKLSCHTIDGFEDFSVIESTVRCVNFMPGGTGYNIRIGERSSFSAERIDAKKFSLLVSDGAKVFIPQLKGAELTGSITRNEGRPIVLVRCDVRLLRMDGAYVKMYDCIGMEDFYKQGNGWYSGRHRLRPMVEHETDEDYDDDNQFPPYKTFGQLVQDPENWYEDD